jgi:serine/threonine protein kinase
MLQFHTKFIGELPTQMIDRSPRREEFFDADRALKSEQQWCQEQGIDIGQRYDCIDAHDIDGVVMGYEGGDEDDDTRAAFLDLIRRTFEFDPDHRITPQQALAHPFMTNG